MVGQAYRQLGSRDLCLDKVTGKLDFRLQRQLRAYKKTDLAPSQVKPIPIQLIHTILHNAQTTTRPSASTQAIADMICIAFFFLLRPGEYTYKPDNTPFCLQDVTLFIGQRRLTPYRASTDDLTAVSTVALRFTTQKTESKTRASPTVAAVTPSFVHVWQWSAGSDTYATSANLLTHRSVASSTVQPKPK
jgi:hypothetical protein